MVAKVLLCGFKGFSLSRFFLETIFFADDAFYK